MARLTPRTKKQEFFSDFTSNLEQVPGRTDVARHVTDSAVKDSIKNLAITPHTDRLVKHKSKLELLQ